jgi:hypothetical protein
MKVTLTLWPKSERLCGDVRMSALNEPRVHSYITDALPEKHSLAWKPVACRACGELVHASNNECMQTWIETGSGNFCLNCFAAYPDSAALDDDMGLAE